MTLALFAVALLWVMLHSERVCSSQDDDGAVSCCGNSVGSFAIAAPEFHSASYSVARKVSEVAEITVDALDSVNTGSEVNRGSETYRVAPKTSPPCAVAS